MTTDSNSIQFSELLDWLESRLSDEEARAITERLQNADEATQADLAWLRAFQQATQTVKLASPPATVRAELKRRFAIYAETRRPPGFFRQWLASLTFDSRTQWATAGVRSAVAEGQRRQLIYTTAAAEVAVNIQPRTHDPYLDVIGQVFPGAELSQTAFSVQLLQHANQVEIVTADDLGEFAFMAVPPGEYDVVVSAADFELVMRSVPVQR